MQQIQELKKKFAILVVDDENAARRLISDILRSENYLVVTGESVQEAREALQRQKIGIIITDIRMPKESGLELLKYVKENQLDIPVILLTGHGDKLLAIESIRAGAFDFIEKPFEDGHLYVAVEKAMQHEALKTQLREAHAHSIQTSKLASIGELAAGIGHEINNPLTVILGQLHRIAQFGEEYRLADPRFLKALEISNKAAARIAKIVKGLGIYARKDEGEKVQLDIDRVIRDAIDLVHGIYRNDNVNVSYEPHAENHHILGNEIQLQQVLINLLTNARDALERVANGKIRIVTQNDQDAIIVEIIDNGCGIKAEHIPRIFDSFFTTKPVGQGTGLGLSITFRIMQQMQGAISVTSHEGVGTSFILRFPLVNHQVQPTTEITPRAFPKISGIALIVEDEDEIRELIREYCEEFGLTVETAEDGLKALEKLSSKRFDYLLTDLKMPRLNGDELIQKTWSDPANKDLKRFVITASLKSNWSELDQENLTNYIDGYILKPFTKEGVYKLLTHPQTKSSSKTKIA